LTFQVGNVSLTVFFGGIECLLSVIVNIYREILGTFLDSYSANFLAISHVKSVSHDLGLFDVEVEAVNFHLFEGCDCGFRFLLFVLNFTQVINRQFFQDIVIGDGYIKVQVEQ
jgi:hypothetical protein